MDERFIFLAALEKAPAERPAFLAQACGSDPLLRQQVEALIRSHEHVNGFLECGHQALTATVDVPASVAGAHSRIGPYKLIKQIGEGGMGTVWMAEQAEPVRRTVALKIIKPGMDSSQVIARFEVERQALAVMDHPNIAKVLEAGTTETGRPYFVMELVQGVPITQYCDQQRLSPRKRLELFIPVCQAIQHAHQKGIVHRDVKPTNVLVASYDGRPVPKVIDFGVAKAMGQKLTDRTVLTGLGGIVGSLEYMSPEQAKFQPGLPGDVDARSDIYGLGVLLYELLTGTTPLTKERLVAGAIEELLRVIREEEPPRPSTRLAESKDTLASISAQRRTQPDQLPRLLRGGLDWIVMKALEKDRTRRYETASGLARDVERYLNDEPVQARPPSVTYRLQKLLHRHRAPIAAVSALAATLVLGATVSKYFATLVTAEAERATRVQQRADSQARQATAAAERATRDKERADSKARESAATADELRRQRDLARRLLYISDMSRVQNAWEQRPAANRAGQALSRDVWFETHVTLARNLLGRHRPRPGEEDLRGFEWFYWNRLSHPKLTSLSGHTAVISNVALSPDGKWLATASLDGTVVMNGQEIGDWNKFGDSGPDLPGDGQQMFGWNVGAQVCSLAFNPDCMRLASGDDQGRVIVWESTTGQTRYLRRGTVALPQPANEEFAPVYGVIFSPDGQRLASFDHHTVDIWDRDSLGPGDRPGDPYAKGRHYECRHCGIQS